MGEDCEQVEAFKKGRHRKKHLYNSILHQMEFYFSDANLCKDRFLSQLISNDPEVDINIFLHFNKIRKLKCTIEDICKAVSKSDLIELSEDKQKVFRKKPIKIKQNVDECTIYIENIKADANHEWLRQVFSDFGNVVYVSIPKYKLNKGNKGFAFVEFESEKEAQNALDFFESIECKMPIETNPGDLTSIQTFENETDENLSKTDTKDSEIVQEENKIKRRLSEEFGNAEKKPKFDIKEELESKVDIKKESEPDESESKKKKKHKKDKRKSYIKELGLQILSKKDWKRLRNSYLNLQRKKMADYKLYLRKEKLKQKNIDKHQKTQSLEITKTTDDILSTETERERDEAAPLKLEFISGVIVKIKLPEPCLDEKKIKNELKMSSPNIKYVDIPLPAGNEEIFVRFANNESAKEFCLKDFIGEKIILENKEEKLYWEKIKNDRVVKFQKCMKKQRGRDKLLKRAEKERAKHMRFDDAD